MEYEQMRQMEVTHCCAECQGRLVTIWDKDNSDYRLVCAMDHDHHGYQWILTPSQAIAQGRADKDIYPGAQKDMEKMAENRAPVISRLADKDLATGQLIPRPKILALIAWGLKLKLKPYLGHCVIYFDNPYVTIDGYYYLNNKREQPYVIGTRPATKEERADHQVGEQDHVYIAEAWIGGEKLQTIGLGIATKDELEAKSKKRPEEFRAPVAHEHPQRMAEKRAEWQLLRKLIPLEEQE